MACRVCKTNVYNMACISCAARHCLMMFYPPAMNKWSYVEAVAEKYGHDKQALAGEIKKQRGDK